MIRSSQSRFEIKDNRRLTFYAAVYNSETTVWDFLQPTDRVRTRYREIIEPGAFTKSLAGNREVIATVDHDIARTFAKRSDGSLIMQEDPKGLFCSAWLPDTELGDGIIKDVNSGLIWGCSFRADKSIERISGNQCVLQELSLNDVCVTGDPAYKNTDVIVRTRASRLRELLARIRIEKIRATN